MNRLYSIKNTYLFHLLEYAFLSYLDRISDFIKLVKRIKYVLLFIGVAGFFSSCSKDVIDNPSTDFVLVNKADSIYAGQLVTFDFSGSSADNITIYTGDPGHAYANYPIDKGAAVTTPYSKYYYTYPQGGDFTITVVAENAGSDGKTVKTVLKTLSVTVKDARNPLITKFVLKKRVG